MEHLKCECIRLVEETARDLRKIKNEFEEYIKSLQMQYPVYKSDCKKNTFYGYDHQKYRNDFTYG